MADLDILDPDAAKSAVNMRSGNVKDEARLELMVSAISQRLDEAIGPVVNREVTETHGSVCGSLWPRQTPVASITSIRTWDGSTLTSWTEATFGVVASGDTFRLDQSGSYAHNALVIPSSAFSGQVELVYVAGRAATTADVPARIAECASEILNDIWKRESPKWAQSADYLATSEPVYTVSVADAVTRRVKELLPGEMKLPGIA